MSRKGRYLFTSESVTEGRQRVPEDDPASRQRARECFVPRRGLIAVGAIGLREDDVQRHDRGPLFTEPGNQLGDAIAAPRPLTDFRQAEIVDVDDRDAGVWRANRNRAEERIVGGVVDAGNESWPVDDQRNRQNRGGEAAQQNEPPALSAGVRGVRRDRVRHRMVISTRRLRGSAVLSGVLRRRSLSPCDSISITLASRPTLSNSVRTARARSSPSR